MNFFKTFFASCLGAVVAMATVVFLGVVTIMMISSEKEVAVGDNSVLHLRLDAPISELEAEDPLAEIFPGAADQSHGLLQLKQAIRHAKSDPKIKGIYLNSSMTMSGVSTLTELREALIDFKSSGKWVISYAEFYTEGAYYLASAADEVYMDPAGEIEFNGLATEVTFFKKLFDRLEINPQVFRVGDFKSAVEPFIRENLSEENKLQLNSILNSINSEIIHKVSESRKIPYEKLKDISDKMIVRNASDAVSNGLIDSLIYEDELRAKIRKKLGLSDKKIIPLVKYSKYRKSYPSTESSVNEIAVIVADGVITPGKAEPGVVGAATFVEQIRKARNNDKVKAIIIRINSPGGVFQAADNMWREITLAAAQKPVIASMSDLAASGGYYIAMGCDTIVAEPTTITGSIGVFSVLFDLSKFLDDKLGITSEEVKTGDIGQLATVTRRLTDVEKEIWQKRTNEIYAIFTGKAAKDRKMELNDLLKIASGRVWTGSQAKDNGLADVLGGFETAVKIAADKAGLGEDYKLRYYPRPKPLLDRLMGDVEDNVKERALRSELGEHYGLYQQWQKIKYYQGMQARLPLEFELK